MTRRLHRCLACAVTDISGLTRHKDQVCSSCRRRGVRHRDGVITVPLSVRLLPALANPLRPTFAELAGGTEIGHMVAWHGTDCPCSSCSADRFPGRYA